jgi:hypothetical protein
LERAIKGEVIEKTNKTPKEKSNQLNITKTQSQFANFLSDRVAAKVQIKKQPSGNGKVIINFNSEVDLNRIIEILND